MLTVALCIAAVAYVVAQEVLLARRIPVASVKCDGPRCPALKAQGIR